MLDRRLARRVEGYASSAQPVIIVSSGCIEGDGERHWEVTTPPPILPDSAHLPYLPHAASATTGAVSTGLRTPASDHTRFSCGLKASSDVRTLYYSQRHASATQVLSGATNFSNLVSLRSPCGSAGARMRDAGP